MIRNTAAYPSIIELVVAYSSPTNLRSGETWVGWIYLDYDGDEDKTAEAVVYVRDDLKTASWELSEESSSGGFR